MKINIISILKDHLKTLRTADAQDIEKISSQDRDEKVRICRDDFLIFFVIPAVVSLISAWFGAKIDKDTYGMSISVFSIFSALLLNVQIALFAVYQRAWSSLSDKNLDAIQQVEIKRRNDLLSQINTNISYLIIISCFSVTAFLIFYMVNANSVFSSFISIYIYVHFLFTLLMVIKRSHALFENEYTKKA